jgi:hypothetical protein
VLVSAMNSIFNNQNVALFICSQLIQCSFPAAEVD